MSSRRSSNESGHFKFFKSTHKRPNHQEPEKSPTEQAHAQDVKKAETRETEGVDWDNHIDDHIRK